MVTEIAAPVLSTPDSPHVGLIALVYAAPALAVQMTVPDPTKPGLVMGGTTTLTVISLGVTIGKHWLVTELFRLFKLLIFEKPLVVSARGHTPILVLAVLVTFTITVQLLEAGTTKLVTCIVLPPVVTLVASAALTQVPVTVVLAIIKPLGNVSLKLILLIDKVPGGFVMVNTKLVTPPLPKIAGLNAFVKYGVFDTTKVAAALFTKLCVPVTLLC